MVRFGFALAGCAVLVTVHAGLTMAQESPTGVLNAVAFKPLPSGAPILVRPFNDTDENLAIKKEFEEALKARGYTIGTDPKGIVLSFESRSQPGYWTSTPQRKFVELQGSAGSGTRLEKGSRGVVNLYNSQQGAVFNEGKRNVVTPAATLFRLDVNIDDKTEGKSLWLAWALANLAEGDTATLARAMVPVIVDTIGEGAKEQPFKLLQEPEDDGADRK
jgi:hypothetical protein